MSITETLEANRKFYRTGGRYLVATRRQMLRSLLDLLKSNREYLISALANDLKKSETEAMLTEYIPLCNAIKYLYRNLSRFAAPTGVGASFLNFPSSAMIYPEPYGQVLIFGAWNYPLLLSLEPVAGALAAGNRVVLMLHDQAPATGRIIRKMLENWEYNEALLLCDSREISPELLLREQFDYIFYTGGRFNGEKVALAAAKNLTPVTLELGGKSPAIVDADADLSSAARRIVWGKFLNAGQTCVAPDYLLVHKNIRDKFLDLLLKNIRKTFGEDPILSENYGRIVNSAHFDRLASMISSGRLLAGGERLPDDLYIAPTVIDRITPDDPIMREEIFGPILPVIEIESIEDALVRINRLDKPLALYYFGKKNLQTVLAKTSSGAVAVNDTVMQMVNPNLPFGGVGASGMGRYHGKYSFETFTHYKPVLHKCARFDLPFRYRPYAKWLVKFLKKIF